METGTFSQKKGPRGEVRLDVLFRLHSRSLYGIFIRIQYLLIMLHSVAKL